MPTSFDSTSQDPTGLGNQPKSEWPKVEVSDNERPIDRLKPGTELHDRVRDYLVSRIETSERHMARFYHRWQVQERKLQAVIKLPDWEEELRRLNNKGEPPKPVRIVVPFSFATISTIVTFLLHVFAGRRPLFPVGSWKDETTESAQMMELKLQYDADHTKMVQQIWRFLQNTQVYGVGIFGVRWMIEREMRSRFKDRRVMMVNDPDVAGSFRSRERVVVFEGNKVHAQDPYSFFPDPRVAMTEVNREGEYVFFRNFEGKHILKRLEADEENEIRWVDWVGTSMPKNETGGLSDRALLAQGITQPGQVESPTGDLRSLVQVDQGTVDVIPAELGLGPSQRVERWMFSLANKKQIIQAVEFDMDHGMHPCAVAEPYAMGYDFGAPGMADYLGPLQDVIGWFFDSHLDNVRRVLNDIFVVDPSMVEMQDLNNPGPGKRIRLKRAAFGQDVRQAIQQLTVQDVTSQHMEDAQLVFRLGAYLSGVDENLMGVQETGGRKTATEVRTAGEAGASRLAAQARIISGSGIVDLTKIMSLNNQQWLSDEFFLRVVGREGLEKPIRVTPDQLAGDFYYPVSDGSLPQDRVALMDVWREIFVGMLRDPELRQTYDIARVFEHIAELGGARNIESFRRNKRAVPQVGVANDEGFQRQLEAGNLVPLAEVLGSGGNGNLGTNTVNATRGSPGDRLAGAF